MKIDFGGSTPEPIITPEPGIRSGGNNQDATSTSQVYSAGEDTTTLSYDRANIGALTSQAMSAADVRQDKVDTLRQAISSGQYEVAPDKIADAMLQGYPK
jgi:negative regulator of flagellin synthesis FlgM